MEKIGIFIEYFQNTFRVQTLVCEGWRLIQLVVITLPNHGGCR
jgi:hypothetical protein